MNETQYYKQRLTFLKPIDAEQAYNLFELYLKDQNIHYFVRKTYNTYTIFLSDGWIEFESNAIILSLTVQLNTYDWHRLFGKINNVIQSCFDDRIDKDERGFKSLLD